MEMTEGSPFISILMTAYNREKYIGEAIQSVLNSTYTNFELIIVDDGSKDNTVNIAKNFEQKDSRIKVYINEKNLGDYPNRNKAAGYATGKYIKYLDADDIIYPWGIQLMVQLMEKFPEAGWGLSNQQDKKKPFPLILNPDEIYNYNYRVSAIFHRSPLSAIIKREAFESLNGFANIRMAGDFEMWNRLGQKFPLVLMPHGIGWYRKHAEQEMNSYRKYIKVYERIKLKYLRDENCPLEKNEVKAIIRAEKRTIKKEILKSALTLNVPVLIDNYHRLSCF